MVPYAAYIISLGTSIDKAKEVSEPNLAVALQHDIVKLGSGFPAMTQMLRGYSQSKERRISVTSVKPNKNFLDPSDYSV